MRTFLLTIAVMLCWLSESYAQGFFNLTADDVKIDSLLPCFTYTKDLGGNYADSTYTVTIDYPEFMSMTATDVARYKAITSVLPPAMPIVESNVGVVRKKGQLDVAFTPIVFREGRLQKLVSFKLTVTSEPKNKTIAASKSIRTVTAKSSRYADHSVLQSGQWAKIRVADNGVYQITEELIRKAGFSDINKVHVYGYGGQLQPESLTESYLTSTDDLKEVPLCVVGGKRLFYAYGPVSYSSSVTRTRNPYSDYGYYFLTSNDNEVATVDSATFVDGFYEQGKAADFHCALYEVDNYAWVHSGSTGGRNLYDSKVLGVGQANDYTLTAKGEPSYGGKLRVVATASSSSVASVAVNDSVVGTISVPALASSSYDSANKGETVISVGNLRTTNKITITQSSGGDMRLDYILLYTNEPQPCPQLATDNFPVPEYVYGITNQNHHADTAADMIIIIPTSQKLLGQAERLKTLHEQHDGLRVRIVPADELYNEFSSGTPDATAYRRYLKMLYDRAESDNDMPRYLLLFGDGVWDNRMRTSYCSSLSPDDFLLCFESENSYSQLYSFVSDDFYCMLDDGEQLYSNSNYTGKPDVAVGRLTARTPEQAAAMVDKIEAYIGNDGAGSWKNTFVSLGDDGDENQHMQAADEVAKIVENLQPNMYVRRIMWDAYQRQSSSTGYSYPDVETLIKKYMANGALVINYNGHGSPSLLSHESVLHLNDFASNKTSHLPLWVTASCDIAPFDTQEDNIGETAMYNPNGGAVAFVGTTRTVYTNRNLVINRTFTKHLFSSDNDGKRNSIGEALRLAKVELVTPTSTSKDYSLNKLQYVLLGDPALVLSYPNDGVVVDSINGIAIASGETQSLKAGDIVSVKGHVTESGFNGTVNATMYDEEETVTCRLNDTTAADEPFTFTDRPNMVYNGVDSVRNSQFAIRFAVPKDISYGNRTGRMLFYAVNSNHTKEYNGNTENFYLNGTADVSNDSIGPNIYCYLNSPSFVNGGNVNSTPYFYAELYDKDGLNVAGSGIGHDLQLVIDGQMSMTYDLNDYFSYDFGSYTSGTVGYSIPQLSAGTHKLRFRAWDALNNSSTAELYFNVVDNLSADLVSVGCTKNPATSSTQFIIVHDRIGSDIKSRIDVYDMTGRMLWTHSEQGEQASNTMTVDWDLTGTNGQRLGTGVYLYRVSVSSDGSEETAQTKKLIIITNK